ncbi:hypothetical protein ACWERF_19160 [Streptomyces griseoluteus]
MTVQAPEPGDGDGCWEVEVGRRSATGSTVIGCALPAVPDADEVAHLLKSVEEKPLLLAQWAETPVGAALAGTTAVVTKRYDS